MDDPFDTSGMLTPGTVTSVSGQSTPLATPPPPMPLKPPRPKPGILRLDINRPRRSSGGSVDFRIVGSAGGVGGVGGGVGIGASGSAGNECHSSSGVTSPHQLSVTWAPPCDFDARQELRGNSMQSNANADVRREYYKGRGRRSASNEDRYYEPQNLSDFPRQLSGEQSGDFSIDFEHRTGTEDTNELDDEEDYSISVSAIMQRRASVRGYRGKRGSRNSRRGSSPMDHVLDSVERRRSSVYTTSSDEGTNQESTQEQIFENIRLHKEVIQSVKLQPWPIRKKLKLVRQAKTYVARHEGALQERFAMSRSTRDLWARFKILTAARWRHWKRETTSFLTVLIPWELRIKEIESHFGSGVASYFTFLRWLMWVNIMIAIPLVAFVIGPEYFATKHGETDPRKRMTDNESKTAGNLFTFWEFEGYLKYSPMFYGYYSSFSGISTSGYKLPLAYFLTAVLVYIYSFVATLRKMAENSRNSKLSSKDDECVFSWKLFTGWDFMIGHAETAHNRIASVVVGFKEALLEEAEKKKDNRNWRIILQRILVNIIVMALLVASGYTVVVLVNKSEQWANDKNWLSRNAVNVTMTLLSFFLPMIFEALGLIENWHPRQQLRLQLGRIMILNMLNLYSLMFSFIYKINSKEKPLQDLKINNDSYTKELHELLNSIETLRAMTTTTTVGYGSDSTPTAGSLMDDFSTTTGDFLGSTTEALLTTVASALSGRLNVRKCMNKTLKCSKLKRLRPTAHNITTTLLLLNLTTTALVPNTTTTPTTTTTILTTPMTSTTTTALTPTTTSTTTTIATTEPPKPDATTLEYDDSSDNSTTPSPSSTTTTAAPGDDSFFAYMDYFDAMPLEDPAAATTSDTADATARDDERPSAASDGDDIDAANRALTRKARQAESFDESKDSDEPLTAAADGGGGGGGGGGGVEGVGLGIGQRARKLRPSIYSRRAHSQSSSTSTTSGVTNTLPITTTTTTSSTTTTSTTTEAPTTTASNTLPATTELTLESKRKILNYFKPTTTTSDEATTTEMTTTEPPMTTTTTSSEFESTTTEATDDKETSTPLNIDYSEIIEFGSTVYYDPADLNDDDDEFDCIVKFCIDVPDDSFYGSSTTGSMDGATTESDTELATTTLTPLEMKSQRLIVVREKLKGIQNHLASMCWETSLGQELSKVIVFDGLMSILAPLCIDFLRALFVRYVNQNWCWDMEKTFPQYGDFKIAENILTLINNQGQVWMGIFFSPGLVLINLGKLMIMMYFRSWIVLTCNVPHEVVFKASKSNNFYLSLLLTMLFLCVLPVGYAIVWLRPSWHCGPFSEYNRIAEFITNTTREALPKQLHEPLDYLTSSSTVIPLLLLLILIIYYLISLTGALREANQDLRTQLQKEREEERKKIFKVPEIKQTEPTGATLTNRWRKVLEASSPVTPTQAPDFETEEYKNQARKELISRIMKKALRKGSATSDDDSYLRHARDDDDTDTEHQDSLPHDEEAKDKRFGSSRLTQIRRTRKPSLVDIVQIAKSERARSGRGGGGGGGEGGGSGSATSPEVQGQSGSNVPTTKDTQPKHRFSRKEREAKEPKELKEDKASKEKKEAKDVKPPPYEASDDNDPDVNSRIVNERRASLLSLKREQQKNEEKPKEVEPLEPIEPKPEPKAKNGRGLSRVNRFMSFKIKGIPPVEKSKEVSPTKTPPNSNFAVVDEKKPLSDSSDSPTKPFKPQLPMPAPPSEIGVGKFKFRKHKSKGALSQTPKNEPEVFTFDDKTVAKSKLGRPVDIPKIPSSEHLRCERDASPSNGDSSTSPSPSPTFLSSPGLRQAQAEKLAQLSRQGRKKIGTLIALVRDKVNIKKDDGEQASDESSIQTPSPTLTVLTATPSTAIEMPPTPEAEPLPPPPVFIIGNEAVVVPAKTPARPATPKLATPEDLEELDQPGPITFPIRSASQRRRSIMERPPTVRQDSQASIWSDNIPTITISTTGSDECIVDPATATAAEKQNGEKSPSPEPVVNIIKINIEDEVE